MHFFLLLTLLIWSSVLLGAVEPLPQAASKPPRKVIVGTVCYSLWGQHPGVAGRTAQLVDLIDKVQAEAQTKYGRAADIIALPEEALSVSRKGTALERSLPYDGAVRDAFSAVARKYHCYIVLPMDLLEDAAKGICHNAQLLIDRDGSLKGIYRKVHTVYDEKTFVREGGMAETWDVPVFDCDFGRVGMQICWDMEFDEGWESLRKQGAEIVFWSSMSPVTAMTKARALQNRYFIVSSQWRDNAAIFEPTGLATAQIESPKQILVQEIDLSYAILDWSPTLADGQAFTKAFADRIGFRYYPREDCGIFWSNDKTLTIGDAMKQLGLRSQDDLRVERRARFAEWRHKAGK
ncbi:MAG: carbon-nitrogen hydrolase family protein [Planctomycetota bacterium]